ncbi:MAG: hypothetical protein ACTSPG_03085 [Candidatus Hodarchaeales archaeon]
MIWNFQIIIELILGLVTLVLAFYGCFIAYTIIKPKNESDPMQFQIVEKKYYLLSMISIIVLFSRIINVFFFYLVLVSLIPAIPGAMCPYGVLDASLPMSGFIDLFAKLFIPFAYGAWLILDNINKRTKSLDLLDSLAKGFIYFMFPLLLLDSILDLIYFGNLKTMVVNCCRSVFNEAASYNPIAILGENTAIIAFLMTLGISVLIAILQLKRKTNEMTLYISMIAAISLIPIFWITLQDFIAPLWIFVSKSLYNQELGAAHHCPFCLLKRWWSMVPFVILIWLGVASIGWQFIIKITSKKTQDAFEIGMSTMKTLRYTSGLSFIIGLMILLGHILVFAVLGLP